MGLFSSANKGPEVRISRDEALRAVPVRNREVTETRLDSGLVRLSYPLMLKPWFHSLAKRFGAWEDKPLTKTVELDVLGTFVWNLVDGSRNVRAIAGRFAAEYGVLQREAELSVTAFMREMGRRGILGLR